ncbi:MAG: acetyl-CoA carboxylase carboxyltransferase subunit beta [Nitrospirae bacterium]|nr:acetyl-CoA carboxylase carboxyltransferase subunit beta [Nitrospirota bacterium]MBF0540567.1 acetyl-CoA carboxylase carboxyltransferase subunit beta [Nitrospirota bacterium]
MAWFKKTGDPETDKTVKIPQGLWVKCSSCKEIVYSKEFIKNLEVCPKCNYHSRIGAYTRINLLVDHESFSETNPNLVSADPLNFVDTISYKERLTISQEKSRLKETVVTGLASIKGIPISLVVMDFSFLGGSMGSAVGEKIVRAVNDAIVNEYPLVIFSSSGGARMQEGIFSLMQMSKISAAIGRLKEHSLPYLSVLTDPTFGGVSASFAMLGDIIIAEPKSLIGFAGARVISQTIKQKLPEHFQEAEFLLSHGLIDMIVDRKDMQKTITSLLIMLINR